MSECIEDRGAPAYFVIDLFDFTRALAVRQSLHQRRMKIVWRRLHQRVRYLTDRPYAPSICQTCREAQRSRSKRSQRALNTP